MKMLRVADMRRICAGLCMFCLMAMSGIGNWTVYADGELIYPESLNKERYVFYASGKELENISTDGCVVTLNFVIAGDAAYGEHSITVDVVQVINVAGEEVHMAAENGKVTIRELVPPTVEETARCCMCDGCCIYKTV